MGAEQPSLLVLALACLVTGVRADNTLTALIVSSCIAGALLLVAILGGVIFCVLRYNRNRDDQDKPHAPLANGYYRPGGQPPPCPRARAKAFTQHAPAQRQRPPLTFYTMRADPRDVGLAGPLGTPFMAAPPNFGRPVLYLDMLDAVGPTANGTTPRNANGAAPGLLIREVESAEERTSAEERYRRKEKKKSRGRSKSRSRGESPTGGKERSRSRSRDATLDGNSKRKSRRSNLSLEETPILAMPGDIILAESHAPRESAPLSPGQMERGYGHNHVEDSSAGGFTTTTLQQRRYTMTFDNDPEPEEDNRRADNYYRPSSASRADDTFATPTADYSVDNRGYSEPPPPPPPPPPPTCYPTSGFGTTGMDLDAEPTPTPRADYPEPVSQTRESPLQSPHKRMESQPDYNATPRADYSARPDSSKDTRGFSFEGLTQTFSPPVEKSADGSGDRSFEAILNSVNFSDGRGGGVGVGGLSDRGERPPTPPFDGEGSPRDSMYPPRPASLRQRDFGDSRIPTPPPDIPNSPTEEGDVDTGEAFTAAALAARPPTPPPGKILRPTQVEMDVLRDLQEEGGKAREQRSSSQAPPLPFMAELKRRQRDPGDDEDEEEAEGEAMTATWPTPPCSAGETTSCAGWTQCSPLTGRTVPGPTWCPSRRPLRRSSPGSSPAPLLPWRQTTTLTDPPRLPALHPRPHHHRLHHHRRLHRPRHRHRRRRRRRRLLLHQRHRRYPTVFN